MVGLRTHEKPFKSFFLFYHETVLAAFDGGLTIDKEFKQFRKSYEEVDAYYDFLLEIWLHLLNRCPGFDAVVTGKKKPGELRLRAEANGAVALDENAKPIAGGSIFARPLGQFIVADVLKTAGLQGKSIKDTIDALMGNVSMDIDRVPWVSVIWNPLKRQIIGTRSERALVTNIISHALGLKIGPKIREMTQDYRDTTGDKKANLLPQIKWSGATTHSVEDAEGNTEADI